MARPYSFEEFDLLREVRKTELEKDSSSEREKLDSFERGYKAGWDDATTAQHQDQSRISSDLESSLNDLAFTFHEARSHVLNGVEPLLRELVKKIFPRFAQDRLPVLIKEHIATALAEVTERPIILCVSPKSRAAVESALPLDPGFPITVKEEPTLSDGQVFLNLGATEEVLDLDEVLSSVNAAISDFFEINQRMQVNG